MFTKDLRETRDRVQGQTMSYSSNQIAGYYARDRLDAGSTTQAAGSEDENDDDHMGFTNYGHGSPPPKKAQSLLGCSPRKVATKRSASQSLTDLMEKEEADGELPEQVSDSDMAEATQREKPDLNLGPSSPVELPSAGRGRGGRGRSTKGGGRGGRKGGEGSKKGADAAAPPQELLYQQLEKDRVAFADRVLWETRVKDKAVEKMGNNLEGLIDKVLAANAVPDAALMEDCAGIIADQYVFKSTG